MDRIHAAVSFADGRVDCAEDRLNWVRKAHGTPIVKVVRCPTCEEIVDPSMALRAGRTAYLLCWNGHRFGLDGSSVPVDATPVASTPIALTERASSEAGAG